MEDDIGLRVTNGIQTLLSAFLPLRLVIGVALPLVRRKSTPTEGLAGRVVREPPISECRRTRSFPFRTGERE